MWYLQPAPPTVPPTHASTDRTQTPTGEAEGSETSVLSASGSRIRELLDSDSSTETVEASIPVSTDDGVIQLATVVPAALTNAHLPTPVAPLIEPVLLTPETEANLAQSVVRIVTPTGGGSATVLDERGLLLTPWHVVRRYPRVTVLVRTVTADQGVCSQAYVARVVKLDETSDLALLELTESAEDLAPTPFAVEVRLQRGQSVLSMDSDWTPKPAELSVVRPDGTWQSGHNVTHRATLIKTQASPNAACAPLFNNQLQLVGICANPSQRRGHDDDVALEIFFEFLGRDKDFLLAGE